MTIKQGRERVRRSWSRGVVGGGLAVLLAQLAGSTIALGQPTQPTAPRGPAATAPRGPAGAQAPRQSGTALPPAKDDTQIRVDDNMIVDLHVNDEDLGNVLEMLSIQSQKNIITSKNVSARVTANLYGVTFYEALDAVLNVNGYGYAENGNFIMVYTFDELKAIEAQQRKRTAKVIPLNYLAAVDAAEFVKPLLTAGGANGEVAGQIKTNGKIGNFPNPGDTPIGGEDYANTARLVIYDYEENVAEIEALVKQIDTRPAQVLVEATILQTELNESNAFGVDFSVIADINFGDFIDIGGPLQAANALIAGRTAPSGGTPFPDDGKGLATSTGVGNVAGPGGLKVGVVANDVAFFMRVLDEVTDTTVISNPKIMTLNRQASRVLVGRKVGYLSSTSTDTATTQTVQFLDTGTQLYFRPFVTNEGMIRMELKPQVSEAVIRVQQDSSGSSVTIPDEITQELVTNVLVRDGQTVVLGGLFRESTQSTRRQVPLLGDIPIIGYAFRGMEDTTERQEIIFLITPSLVNDASMAAAGERGVTYVDRVHAGARQGVLFWSRDRLTNGLNIRADAALKKGDNDSALWLTRRSLRLNPTQPEIIALRERAGGSFREWSNRSILNRIVDGETSKLGTAKPMAIKPNAFPWAGKPKPTVTHVEPEVTPEEPTVTDEPVTPDNNMPEEPTTDSTDPMANVPEAPADEMVEPTTPEETVPDNTEPDYQNDMQPPADDTPVSPEEPTDPEQPQEPKGFNADAGTTVSAVATDEEPQTPTYRNTATANHSVTRQTNNTVAPKTAPGKALLGNRGLLPGFWGFFQTMQSKQATAAPADDYVIDPNK